VFPERSDIWKPLQADPNALNSGWGLSGVGRLKHGITYEQATVDLTRIHKGLIATVSKDNEFTVVLLIACTNIAALIAGPLLLTRSRYWCTHGHRSIESPNHSSVAK
jgi:hypothetical protein